MSEYTLALAGPASSRGAWRTSTETPSVTQGEQGPVSQQDLAQVARADGRGNGRRLPKGRAFPQYGSVR